MPAQAAALRHTRRFQPAGASRCRVPYNFSAGPATLPEPVLRQAQAEMLEYRDNGASIVEISHRGAEFLEVAHRTEADLRTLLSIPDDYAVLFTAGGATTVQALLPLNFAAAGQPVDYVVTGHWGKTALKQAAPYRRCADIAASTEADGFREPAARATGRCRPTPPTCTSPPTRPSTASSSATSPDAGDVPLIADFSSSIASEPLDITPLRRDLRRRAEEPRPGRHRAC